MDRTSAQDWLDRYVAAWRSYDPAEIGALFSDDVVYRFYPADQPTVGRDAVVESWVRDAAPDGASTRDEPGTYDAAYAPIAVDGDVVVARGSTTYLRTPGGPVDRVYDNCFVMRFDDQGRCREFTEFYARRPEPA